MVIMSAIKFFVNKEGMAIIKCPQCEHGKSISVATYKGKKSTIKVNCPCGHSFPISLDFREHHRKKTLLEGNYRKSGLNIESFYEKLSHTRGTPMNPTSDGLKNCTIKDLSVGGLGLDIWGFHSVKEGDALLIEFTLDNKKKSHIRSEVVVKTVRENYVGAEFKEKSEFIANLGFYLMS